MSQWHNSQNASRVCVPVCTHIVRSKQGHRSSPPIHVQRISSSNVNQRVHPEVPAGILPRPLWHPTPPINTVWEQQFNPCQVPQLLHLCVCCKVLQGGGDFATGIFRCGKFRISNVCEISRSIFRPLCEINPVRNLATMLDLESFEMRKGLVAAQNREELWARNASTCLPPPCAASLHLHLYWGHTAWFFL